MSIIPNGRVVVVASRQFHSRSARKINTVTIHFIAQATVVIHDGPLIIPVYQWNDTNESGYGSHNNTFATDK